MKVKESQILEIVNLVKKRLLALGTSRNIELELEERDYHLEDDWLYLCISPKHPGTRASDYAELLSDIEKELREQEIDNVLLVPEVIE